jgi:hypothetical protein
MSGNNDGKFENCHCPHCKYSLHDESTKITACPGCRRPFDARDVWMTRRYPGMMILPGWVKIFGWPLVLILIGLALGALRLIEHYPIPMKLVLIPVGAGMAWAIIIMMTGGEEL